MTTTAPQFFNRIGYSDVAPFEVVRVVSHVTIEIRPMRAERGDWQPEFAIGGFAAECLNQSEQAWKIVSDLTEQTIRIRQHSDGKWRDSMGNKYAESVAPRCFRDMNF